MKPLFYLLLALLPLQILAQDTIYTRSGDQFAAQVEEIDVDVIRYKRIENLNGPQYVMDKADVAKIRYQNGEEDTFSPDESVAASDQYDDLSRKERNRAIFRDILWNASYYAFQLFVAVVTSDCGPLSSGHGHVSSGAHYGKR